MANVEVTALSFSVETTKSDGSAAARPFIALNKVLASGATQRAYVCAATADSARVLYASMDALKAQLVDIGTKLATEGRAVAAPAPVAPAPQAPEPAAPSALETRVDKLSADFELLVSLLRKGTLTTDPTTFAPATPASNGKVAKVAKAPAAPAAPKPAEDEFPF